MTSFLRNCHVFTVPIVVFSALFLASCVSRESFPGASALPRCEVWVRYLPETERDAQFRLGVRPVPMDNGWTELRMKRDIERIKASSIDVVMVEATPMQLSDEWFLSRFGRFQEIAEVAGVGVVVSLVQAEGENVPLERGNLIQYAERVEALGKRGYLSVNGRPALLVDASFNVADPEDAASEQVSLLRFGKELPERRDTPLTDMLPLPSKYRWIYAGIVVSHSKSSSYDTWTIPRRQGASLKRQLKAINDGSCEIVLLDSWNDYARGSFIEPNSMDGMSMMKCLMRGAEAIAR